MTDMTTTTVVTTFVSENKGELVTIFLADGTTVTGTAISVNSKGVNLKMEDGKTRSFGLSRVKGVGPASDEDIEDYDALDDVPEDIAEMLHDGMTTSDLADILDTTPKALRVSLRALGMGVGKGRKYSLSPSAYIAVRNHLAEVPAAS
jgi:hypothetical protein